MMKYSFIAALLAATIAAQDPLMEKLNSLKDAFAQLANESEHLEEIKLAQTREQRPRKSQNLAQVESMAEIEAEVIAEV